MAQTLNMGWNMTHTLKTDRNMAHTLKTQSGASIIEILLAIMVIAITTLIITAFTRNTLLMSKDARANDAAYFVAEQKIADLSNKVFPTASLPQSAANEAVTQDNIAFTVDWAVAQSGYVACATVTVKWTSLKGQKQITLSGAVN
jgi:Tfp pilus assembly protein PilV